VRVVVYPDEVRFAPDYAPVGSADIVERAIRSPEDNEYLFT
jgi:hypothetical protein